MAKCINTPSAKGFENYVFEGGKTLIYNGNVDNILMENSITNITIVGGMVDMLYDAGYRIAEIRSVNVSHHI